MLEGLISTVGKEKVEQDKKYGRGGCSEGVFQF